MSYGPNQMYPGATELDPNYPKDKFKDNNPSTTNNGTPLKAIKENQDLTLETAVMNDAGFEYSGVADTPQDSQLFKAYKASLGNGANLISNHNFVSQTPDTSQPRPDATPRTYPPGYQIFYGVFANETTGITNLTYINGRVSFSGGDLYFPVSNTGAISRLTSDQLTASVADFDGKPRTRGVSFALSGDEYRVTVGIDALEDAGAVLTPLGSVKFEQGSAPTGHHVIDFASEYLKYRVGQKAEIHSSQIPDWLLKADGSTVSRIVDDVLWAHAATSGLVIAQATKDANPEQYAMYYGDGDGSTTFSLPNWYLGHFARGNPAGVTLGETQGDAIREITGAFSAIDSTVNSGSGAFSDQVISSGWLPAAGSRGVRNSFNFAASREVPVASENRPKTGNINICIERGKIPA